MKENVDFVLRKTKRAIDIERVYQSVENLLKKEMGQEDYVLSNDLKEEIMKIVSTGVSNFDYYQTPSGKYISLMKTSFRKGKFHGNKAGEGHVTSITSFPDREGNLVVKEEKFSILKEDCNGAIDGDFVLIDIGGNGVKPKVEKILERNLENIMGEVYRSGNSYFVKPIDKKKQFLTIALEGEAIEGQRVAVSLKTQTNADFYIGEVTRVFNHKDDPDEDILWEAFKCGIDDQFSRESLEQVERIPQSVRDIDRIGREDLTNWEIFTIDGADTKDIDDALSCRRLENGNYEIGVHIADVSYYVPSDSPLDKDAYQRGTSNYLVGKVIPMLPHELSNGICSLNPDVDRLALSCIMEVTPSGQVIQHRVRQTVIHSRLKMTYSSVNQILKEGIIPEEYKEHANTLRLLNKLALVLRKNRLEKGAIEFNRPEMKLIFNEDGEIVDFSVRLQDLGENLIEEYMLLANETVDKHLVDMGYPCLHRVHDKPNKERLEDFLRLLEAIGIPYQKYDSCELSTNMKALQDLSNHVKQNGGYLIDMLTLNMVRCMSRARYSPINIGHSGLAKENYCHFTSPIRRYPDLTVHRLLKASMDDELGQQANKWRIKLLDIGEQSSRREKIADEAEVHTLAMKCSEYMSKHIGEEYEGTVTGLNDRGIQIQLDNLVEGKVHLKSLNGSYAYNPSTYTLLSLDGFENYYIGDRLRVKVVSASKEDKNIEFAVIVKRRENHTMDPDGSNLKIKTKEKNKRLYQTYFK